MAQITSTRLKVGLEIHVELATRSKMFTRAPNSAHHENEGAEPNTLIDPVVLGLPGALPVMNRVAIEMSIKVGLALGCRIAEFSKWDRKGYFYPDLPKGYQISQYDLPLCADGAVDWPIGPDGEDRRIGIIRAHLEEDAGKLLHEAPGGRPIDHSIVDLNRAGAPLLEIVTAPDFTNADEVVAFCQILRNVCRFLGVSGGNMQQGQMRFEPNINMELETDDGRRYTTPIVEIKNLNSFRSVHAAITFEQREQPRRWQEDGRVMGVGAKRTRGWDDHKEITFLQREKEDAHDYRYFPDPDLLPVTIAREWVEQLRVAQPTLPHVRANHYQREFALDAKEAASLTAERETCLFFEACVDQLATGGLERERAGRQCANIILQTGFMLAKERERPVEQLGISAGQVAELIRLREEGAIGSSAITELFQALCETNENARAVAERRGLMQVSDDEALRAWCRAVIEDPANEQTVQDVRGGKMAAVGRLIGGVMQTSGGQADAKRVRELLLELLQNN